MSSCGSPSVLSRSAWGNDGEQNAAPDGGRILAFQYSTSRQRSPQVCLTVRGLRIIALETPLEFAAAVERLRGNGLIVYDNASSTMQLYRTKSTPGNRREEYKASFFVKIGEKFGQDVAEALDAPIGGLMRVRTVTGEVWAFRVWDYCPGPGPGDFEKRYLTLAEATDAVLEYYFGDPGWMCDEYNKHRRETQSRR